MTLLLEHCISSHLCPPSKYNLLSEVAISFGSIRSSKGSGADATFWTTYVEFKNLHTPPSALALTMTSCQPPTMAMAWPVHSPSVGHDAGMLLNATGVGVGIAI